MIEVSDNSYFLWFEMYRVYQEILTIWEVYNFDFSYLFKISIAQFKVNQNRVCFSSKGSQNELDFGAGAVLYRILYFQRPFEEYFLKIAEKAALVLFFTLRIVKDKFMNARSLIYLQNKNSPRIRSWDREGHGTGPSLQIRRLLSFSSTYWRTRIAKHFFWKRRWTAVSPQLSVLHKTHWAFSAVEKPRGAIDMLDDVTKEDFVHQKENMRHLSKVVKLFHRKILTLDFAHLWQQKY